MILKIFEKEIKINYDFADFRLCYQKIYVSNFQKIGNKPNWKPNFTNEEGAKHLIDLTKKYLDF